MKFVVGGGSPSNGFDNPPLDPNKDYKIYIRVESEADGKTTVSCVLVALKGEYCFKEVKLSVCKRNKIAS